MVIDQAGGLYGCNVGTPFDDPTGSDPVLMVIHGTNDSTVPFSFATALQTFATDGRPAAGLSGCGKWRTCAGLGHQRGDNRGYSLPAHRGLPPRDSIRRPYTGSAAASSARLLHESPGTLALPQARVPSVAESYTPIKEQNVQSSSIEHGRAGIGCARRSVRPATSFSVANFSLLSARLLTAF